jgi:hypothetical protein
MGRPCVFVCFSVCMIQLETTGRIRMKFSMCVSQFGTATKSYFEYPTIGSNKTAGE